MPTQTQVNHMTYNYLADIDTHEFIFHQSSRQAVEEWVACADALYKNFTEDTIVRMLMDIRESGALPINHTISLSKKWMDSLTIHPDVGMVYLTNNDPLAKFVGMFINNMRIGHLKVMVLNNRNDSLQFLTEFKGIGRRNR